MSTASGTVGAVQRVVHFRWMGAHWSIAAADWPRLQDTAAEQRPFNLHAFGARELRSRPRGAIEVLRDAEGRSRE